MSYVHPAWVEHQRQRWLQPDWQRWVRHDAHRFAPPGSSQTKSYAARLIEQRQAEESAVLLAAQQDRLRADLERLRWLVADLKVDLALRRLQRKYGFNPDQPRRPKGDPEGPGRWVDEGGQSDRVRLAQDKGPITDAFGESYYQPGGHHELPRALYEKWNLRPETLKVFKDATTGTIPRGIVRLSPDGEPMGHFWNGRNGAHGIYNQAAKELAEEYLAKNNILETLDMTPDQAREILKEIRESKDPRIHDYNKAMRLLRRIFRFGPGRGNE